MRSVIAIMLGLLVPVAPVLADPLPFRDGRYLSMPDLCGLSDEGIVERIGDEIHYILYDINGRNFSGAEFHCEVRSVNTRGSTVEFQAACAMEGESGLHAFTPAARARPGSRACASGELALRPALVDMSAWSWPGLRSRTDRSPSQESGYAMVPSPIGERRGTAHLGIWDGRWRSAPRRARQAICP